MSEVLPRPLSRSSGGALVTLLCSVFCCLIRSPLTGASLAQYMLSLPGTNVQSVVEIRDSFTAHDCVVVTE